LTPVLTHFRTLAATRAVSVTTIAEEHVRPPATVIDACPPGVVAVIGMLGFAIDEGTEVREAVLVYGALPSVVVAEGIPVGLYDTDESDCE
jgi:hypothetical protein